MTNAREELGTSAGGVSQGVAERTIHLEYCGPLHEQAGVRSETVCTEATTASELWDELRKAKGFSLDLTAVRVAINDEFEPWDHCLREGDRVALFPPFSGG